MIEVMTSYIVEISNDSHSLAIVQRYDDIYQAYEVFDRGYPEGWKVLIKKEEVTTITEDLCFRAC